MAGFAELKVALGSVGASIVAASADEIELTREFANGLSFPIAYGVSQQMAESVGAWWEQKRSIVQPAEFVLAEGKVIAASYSDGPIGRMDAADVLGLIKFRESKAGN